MPTLRVCVVLLAGQFVWAASTCDNAETTSQMRACENARFAAADRQLNTVYSDLWKQLNGQQQQKLRMAERAWLHYREANAEFLASRVAPGTLGPLVRVSALADMTDLRRKELSTLSKNEGDLHGQL